MTTTAPAMVTLLSNDNVTLQVRRDVAEQSNTIKNMLEDLTHDEDATAAPIPLHNVTGAVLTKVIEYCQHHQHDEPVASAVTPEQRRLAAATIAPWDVDYCKVSHAELFELILAANYLDIKSLLELTCRSVANNIKGKSPETICSEYGIKCDLTDDEKKAIMKENEWCY